MVVPNLAGPLFLGRDWLSKWNPVIDWVTGELTVPNAGGPWLLKGDSSEEGKHVGSAVEQVEMTPSAYRKLVWVAIWCRDERDPGTFLVVVRTVNVDKAPISS